MNLTEAAAMANELMGEHGLAQTGWTWRWAKGIKVMGHCSQHKREIALYRPYASAATPEQVRDTLLHEIAHALVPSYRDPYTRKMVRHGAQWKMKCLEIGGNGQRCGENPYYRAATAERREERAAAMAVADDVMVRIQAIKVGDMASIFLPNSKHHGFTGRVVTVTDKKIHIESPKGKLMAPKSIVRPA